MRLYHMVFLMLILCSCSMHQRYESELASEIVMPKNSTIEAEFEGIKIIINAGKRYERFYTWNGATRTIVMWPRDKRWNGRLGLYYPGPGFHWEEHDDIRRIVTEEAILHFKNNNEAIKWLNNYYFPIIYTNNGLAVSFSKKFSGAPRYQLNIDVFQILINGEKPSGLEGASNKIKTSF